MALIQITSADAEKVARAFSNLIGDRGLVAIRRRAVNKVGGWLRKETRSIAPSIFGTSAATLSVQGSAATPGSSDPSYRLRMARSIPISRLKAKHRKARRSGGKMSLTINTPATRAIKFSSVERIGKAFKLLRAGPLPERFVGGVSTKARTAFATEGEGGQDELHRLRKRAGPDLAAAVAEAINAHLKGRSAR